MTIDTRDLPPVVVDIVHHVDHLHPAQQAAHLRARAAASYNWIGRFWQQRRWDLVFNELGLVLGYLTAAARCEDPPPPPDPTPGATP